MSISDFANRKITANCKDETASQKNSRSPWLLLRSQGNFSSWNIVSIRRFSFCFTIPEIAFHSKGFLRTRGNADEEIANKNGHIGDIKIRPAGYSL